MINLYRSRDRLSAFATVNGDAHLNFVRFPAIEGKIVERGTITADLGYRNGALGCALSHLALWDLAIQQNRALTICEDDAIFNRGFSPAAKALMQELPPGWDVISWGWNFDSILLIDMIPGVSPCLGTFDQDRMRMGVGAFQSARLTPQLFRLFRALGMVGSSISPRGAQEMNRH